MATSHHWDYSRPESTFNPAVSANVSSYFARPNRIMKPSSRNSSPRHLGRRKTITAASSSSRTQPVIDRLRTSTQWQHVEMGRIRPVSWHPDCFAPSNINFDTPINDETSPCWSFSTAQVNGVITPICFPSVDEVQIQDPFTPLDDLTIQHPSLTYETTQKSWRGQCQVMTESFALPSCSHQLVQPQGYFNQSMIDSGVPTAPPSPDCRPLRTLELDSISLGANEPKRRSDPEELVGMGLYDSPAEIQSSSLLFGGSTGPRRKVLKLEESFEPSEQEGDADDAEEEIEDADRAPQDLEGGDEEETLAPSTTEYDSQAAATYSSYGIQSRPEPLAFNYLATQRQSYSAYYPSNYPANGHGYGWI